MNDCSPICCSISFFLLSDDRRYDQCLIEKESASNSKLAAAFYNRASRRRFRPSSGTAPRCHTSLCQRTSAIPCLRKDTPIYSDLQRQDPDFDRFLRPCPLLHAQTLVIGRVVVHPVLVVGIGSASCRNECKRRLSNPLKGPVSLDNKINGVALAVL